MTDMNLNVNFQRIHLPAAVARSGQKRDQSDQKVIEPKKMLLFDTGSDGGSLCL